MANSSKHLNAQNLIAEVCKCFDDIPDHRSKQLANGIPFPNFAKSAFAMMHQKYSSLLDFDTDCADPVLCHNLTTLYHVKNGRVPCDTHMREVLDPVDPKHFRKPFKKLFSLVQRSGSLKAFEFCCGDLKDHYLMPLDGTQTFYSGKHGCPACCVRNEGKPNESYSHSLTGGCIVHPDQKTVIPFAPEAIVRQDGSTKNDCEKNALKRYLAHVKREHPHIKLIILLDGLYADNPTIELIKKYGWHYIIVAKDGNHESLIEAMNALGNQEQLQHHEVIDEATGVKHLFRFSNGVKLNASKLSQTVNVLDYIEIDKEGHHHPWCWVTDIELTPESVETVMRGGRCRWHIENQTFNTLKNQGYHLEHNYGHGKRHLATNLAFLTFLAFLVDQVQEMASPEFKAALKKRSRGVRTHLWKCITRIFLSWLIESWDELFEALISGIKPSRVAIDTS